RCGARRPDERSLLPGVPRRAPRFPRRARDPVLSREGEAKRGRRPRQRPWLGACVIVARGDAMELDELFNHALTTLPEAVSDILRDGRDPGELVFASFDGSSELGIALIASDISDRKSTRLNSSHVKISY